MLLAWKQKTDVVTSLASLPVRQLDQLRSVLGCFQSWVVAAAAEASATLPRLRERKKVPSVIWKKGGNSFRRCHSNQMHISPSLSISISFFFPSLTIRMAITPSHSGGEGWKVLLRISSWTLEHFVFKFKSHFFSSFPPTFVENAKYFLLTRLDIDFYSLFFHSSTETMIRTAGSSSSGRGASRWPRPVLPSRCPAP